MPVEGKSSPHSSRPNPLHPIALRNDTHPPKQHDIAARFPHAHATATLLRRTIDADEEVAPGRFVVTAREIEGHAGLDENSAFGEAVAKHVYAVKAFIDGVMRGRIATAGNGGVPMKRAIEEGEMRPRRWIYHW